MMDEIINAYGGRFLIAALGVILALAVLVVILWILKNRAPSPFVRGGRSRQPRLQVLDAAAVDARRRLVLVRRDNVEHLILIGGPSDIVVESGIGEPRTVLAGELAGREALEAPPQRREPATTVLPDAAGATSLSQPTVQLAAAQANAAPERQPHKETADRTIAPAPSTPAPVREAVKPIVAEPVSPPAPAPVVAPTTRPENADVAISQDKPAGSLPTRKIEAQAEAASALLDSVRNRVLPPRTEPFPAERYTKPAAAPAPKTAPEPKSEFEKVLDNQMTAAAQLQNTETQKPATALSAKPTPPKPTVEPPVARAIPPIPTPQATSSTAVKDNQPAREKHADAELQDEIARIFGEMNATKN
ncbi:flagellar biosynthetic protein FliO [Allorhizobium undicola]|uniref:flagellar biosynthetic protein FliO n=1 Tax=Allorhizobium undicola TaxID=78527 RepID=UPI003D341C32